jgi:hypothetical protein
LDLISARLCNSHVKIDILPDKLVLRLPPHALKAQRINGKAILTFKNPLSGLTCVAELS